MERIILLTEAAPDLQTHRCIEQMRAGLAGQYDFVTRHVASASWTRLLNGFLSLRKASRGAELVHAWGYRALRLATVAAECPILYTPLPDDPPKAALWARTALTRRKLRVLTLSTADDRFIITSGVPDSACTLVRPGIKMARPAGRDTALRRRLGISDDHIVILAVGESLPHADHTQALHAVTMLNYMNPAFAMLLWGRGPEVDAVARMQTAWGGRHLFDARRILGKATAYESILPAADMALCTAPDRVATMPLLACMAAGVPIVAPATHAVSEILQDHHTALLYGAIRPRTIAQRLLTLWEDEPLRRKLSDQARAEAYELFPVSRFLDALRSVYAANPA